MTTGPAWLAEILVSRLPGSRLAGLRFFHVTTFAGSARLIKPGRVQRVIHVQCSCAMVSTWRLTSSTMLINATFFSTWRAWRLGDFRSANMFVPVVCKELWILVLPFKKKNFSSSLLPVIHLRTCFATINPFSCCWHILSVVFVGAAEVSIPCTSWQLNFSSVQSESPTNQ